MHVAARRPKRLVTSQTQSETSYLPFFSFLGFFSFFSLLSLGGPDLVLALAFAPPALEEGPRFIIDLRADRSELGVRGRSRPLATACKQCSKPIHNSARALCSHDIVVHNDVVFRDARVQLQQCVIEDPRV